MNNADSCDVAECRILNILKEKKLLKIWES
jgi:hypothetical protein